MTKKKPAGVSKSKPRVLPQAFLARAKKVAELSKASKLAKATSLLASIRRRKGEMAGAFWDLGRDLSALQALGVESLLGHKGFFAMVRAECGLSETLVSEGLRIASSLTREEAVELGTQKRATAFLDLARATPEADTAVGLAKAGLTRGKVKLPPGASARSAFAAAKAVRADASGRDKKRPTGRTTTDDERKEAARIASGLKKAGFAVDVRAIATRPGQPCVFSFRLPRDAFATLKALLRAS